MKWSHETFRNFFGDQPNPFAPDFVAPAVLALLPTAFLAKKKCVRRAGLII